MLVFTTLKRLIYNAKYFFDPPRQLLINIIFTTKKGVMRKERIFSLGLPIILAIVLMSSGCTSVIVRPLLDPVELSLQRQTDLELIKDGAPSLLLLLDGFIAKDPHNKNLLMAATKAYGAYAATLYEAEEPERAVTMSHKAKT